MCVFFLQVPPPTGSQYKIWENMRLNNNKKAQLKNDDEICSRTSEQINIVAQ